MSTRPDLDLTARMLGVSESTTAEPLEEIGASAQSDEFKMEAASGDLKSARDWCSGVSAQLLTLDGAVRATQKQFHLLHSGAPDSVKAKALAALEQAAKTINAEATKSFKFKGFSIRLVDIDGVVGRAANNAKNVADAALFTVKSFKKKG